MNSSLTESAVLDALRVVRDPDLHKDIVALGFVKDVRIDGGRVAFTIQLTTPACPVKDLLRGQARAAVAAARRHRRRHRMTASVRAAVGLETKQPIQRQNVIAVGAGKERR
jgi:ATP-binding protein involved in chromosome partitioning